MDTVYRIQDKDGRGPFKPGFSHVWVENRPDLANLPAWFEEFGRVDKLLCTYETAGAGCKTLAQLKRWFTKKEYKKLKKYGYKAVEMNVDRIIAESKVQCFFGRGKPLRKDIKVIKLY